MLINLHSFLNYYCLNFTIRTFILSSIFAFLLSLLPGSLSGQDYMTQVQCFGMEDGLSNNTIYKIFQDSKGIVWIGTQYGLNRLDGMVVVMAAGTVELVAGSGAPCGRVDTLVTVALGSVAGGRVAGGRVAGGLVAGGLVAGGTWFRSVVVGLTVEVDEVERGVVTCPA